jgi:hypothetical protein
MICKAKVRVRFPLLPYLSFRGAFVHPIFLLLLFIGVKRFFIFLIVAHLPDWICLAVGWNPCRLLDRAAISSCWCRHCSYRCCGVPHTAVVVCLIVEAGDWPLVANVSLCWWSLFRSGLNLLSHRCGHRSCCDSIRSRCPCYDWIGRIAGLDLFLSRLPPARLSCLPA